MNRTSFFLSRRFLNFIISLYIVIQSSTTAWAEREPYVATPYVTPPPIPSRLDLVDNGNGTITETKSQLMWTKKIVLPISENV